MVPRKAKRVLLCAVFAILASGSLQKTHAEGPPTLEKIIATWKQRQDNTRTFDFQWDEVRTYTKGSMPVMEGSAGPPEDVTQNNRLSLQVDGDMMRVWRNAPRWNGKFVPRDSMSVFDGKDAKVFYDQADPAVQGMATYRVGFIGIHQYNEDVVDYDLWPILLTYRAIHRDMGRFKQDEWDMTEERGVADGRDCLILRKKGAPIVERCWVDFERDCTVVRYEFITNYRFQVDVSYKDVPGLGPVPASWQTVEYPPSGVLQQSNKAEVTGYTINKPLPDDWFHFEFPVGTDVVDHKNKTEYIVRKDGGKRLITEVERLRGATYEQLVATESGQAGLPPSSRKFWWILVALVFATAVLLAVAVRRRWLRKAS